MDAIGDRVKLKGFTGFRAGLDTQSDQTGTQSLHARLGSNQVMFHVSTLLPFVESDPQQVDARDLFVSLSVSVSLLVCRSVGRSVGLLVRSSA